MNRPTTPGTSVRRIIVVPIGKDYGKTIRLKTRNPGVIEFIRLVEIMRLHQRAYRESGLFEDRKRAKALEERVDDVLATLTYPQKGDDPDEPEDINPWLYTG